MEGAPVNDGLGFPNVLREGVVIAGILLVWGIFSLLGTGISNLGGPGSALVPLGEAIWWLFVLVGVANTLLYVIARGVELSRS